MLPLGDLIVAGRSSIVSWFTSRNALVWLRNHESDDKPFPRFSPDASPTRWDDGVTLRMRKARACGPKGFWPARARQAPPKKPWAYIRATTLGPVPALTALECARKHGGAPRVNVACV
jgi:hypothetical protein